MFHPVLQIVHVSDLHFAYAPASPVRRAAGLLGPLGKWLVDHTQGFAGHDAAALEAFELALDQLLASDPTWKTVLAATGDLSTWGDDRSIDACSRWLRRVARSRKLDLALLYGNHDVWPARPGRLDGLPLFEPGGSLAAMRSRLRSARFSGNYPELAGSVPLPHLGGVLSLWVIDTVVHEPFQNTLAQGEVKEDRYWEKAGLADQLAELRRVAPPGVRVLLLHHPLVDPSLWFTPLPVAGGGRIAPKALANGVELSAEMARPQGGAFGPTAHACLSGHTHEPFPAVGRLPRTVKGNDRMGQLLDDQVQLTAGTLSQASQGGKTVQSFQVLRFHESDRTRRILVERVVYERDASQLFAPADAGRRRAVEEVELEA